MTLLIHLDANIPMYVWGRDHPLKAPCLEVLGLVALNRDAFITDAEVLQELLHRFTAIRAWDRVREMFDLFVDLMAGRIEPMLSDDVVHAARMADRYPALSARDLVHVAIAVRARATHIVSADTAFDALDEIKRLDPARVADWQGIVVSG